MRMRDVICSLSAFHGMRAFLLHGWCVSTLLADPAGTSLYPGDSVLTIRGGE